MPMTSLGKKARWPREMREELNVRLHNGEVGRQFKAEFPSLRAKRVLKSDWKPPRKPRGRSAPKARLHCAQNVAGEAGDLAGAPIKPDQAGSNRGSGQWPVASGWWPVVGGQRRWGRLFGQTQSNPVKPVKPSQTCQSRGSWRL